MADGSYYPEVIAALIFSIEALLSGQELQDRLVPSCYCVANVRSVKRVTCFLARALAFQRK